MATILNASTSSGLVQSADTSGEIELQSNGTTKLTVSSAGVNIPTLTTTTVTGTIVQGTAVASTSGTSIDFTGIPSWVKRVTVMFSGVSTNGSSALQVQLGAGSFTTTGYTSTAFTYNTTSDLKSTTGLVISENGTSDDSYYGNLVINLLGSNTWTSQGIVRRPSVCTSAGGVTLSGTLDRVRITTVNGTDTFDAGTINIQYEG